MATQWSQRYPSRLPVRAMAISVGVALVAMVAGMHVSINVWPSLGAQGAELLRTLIGTEPVTSLENVTFRTQDQLQRWRYQAGDIKPAAPWTATTSGDPTLPSVDNGTSAAEPSGSPDRSASPADVSTPLPQKEEWELAPLTPFSSIAGEGQWSPYIWNDAGQIVAYRTFLQPDSARPYATVAIVAFDLEATQLGFVLGTTEPISSATIDRPGTIPAGDLLPGKPLVAFNGGFKAEHGYFGVMVNQILVLPLRERLGTVAIYSGGQVKIGEWGTEITNSPDIVVLRQNCPLLVHDGLVNPHTANTASPDWGSAVDGAIAIPRSGLGISDDGHVLYYAAGHTLIAPALAQALADAGAEEAMQLDINNFWVHFEVYRKEGANLQAETLLDTMQQDAMPRYLQSSYRDFFYVTER
ncbi:MAG: phosphodiester glycosidase family protein [Anaerolineae bacterium]|nr:phosphodiester glycosidase family protein [Anaerolineae bacterium]